MANIRVKPIRSMLGAGAFLGVDHGRSVSSQAESGVSVSFDTPFNTVPVVAIGQHQEKETWIDPDSVTVNGFTWYATQAEAGIDWIAIGT